MNARQVLGLSALLLSGAVYAQTVPQELWVGAPIPTTVSAASRAAVAAEFAAARPSLQAPQEFLVGPADAPTGAVSRTEVAADLNLWIRSGLAQVSGGDSFDPMSASYRRQVDAYQSMRNGPAFMAEVQRIKGSRMSTMTRTHVETGADAN